MNSRYKSLKFTQMDSKEELLLKNSGMEDRIYKLVG